MTIDLDKVLTRMHNNADALLQAACTGNSSPHAYLSNYWDCYLPKKIRVSKLIANRNNDENSEKLKQKII